MLTEWDLFLTLGSLLPFGALISLLQLLNTVFSPFSGMKISIEVVLKVVTMHAE